MAATGLTEPEAAARLAVDGPNELPTPRQAGWPTVLARQVTDPVVVVLLVAVGLTAAVRDFPDMAVILAVIVLNTALGASQEVRSGRALAALAELTAPRATVLRGGEPRDVDAREVVRGDVLRLAAGDIVAADAELSLAEALQADESMLTGESVPVGKAAGDVVFAGTVITRGRGQASVRAVARETALGGIARSIGERGTRTPLQRQLAGLGRRLALAVAVAAAVLAALNLLAGRSVEVSLVLAISLAVAAIPESLPAVVSLSLALAGRRMAARGVLARRLAAVEALGSVTVLATDKTGTLTEGRMTLTGSWTPPGDAEPALLEAALLEAAVLCNDADGPGHGDPTETALFEGARRAGLDVAAVRARFPRRHEVPFDPRTARMSTTHDTPDGGRVELCKGAPEAVLGELASAPGAADAARAMAAAGQRVLAVAARVDGGAWRLRGLLGLADPPRASAAPTVAAFRRAGVRPVMITGDHPVTAAAVAGQVGIDPADVYARVRPEQKTALVEQLRGRGEIVAMTGDGVNDAPALRAADIGVAMGRRGTEVAKQAAGIVLTGDDLSAMVPAIAEGRRSYDNLRRFLHYALAGGVAEVLIMLAGPAWGFAIPLQAGQILWVNLLTHGLPGVAMGNEPAAADVPTRPPRPPGERLLDARTARRVGVLGSAIAALTLGAGLYARHADRPWQSTMFLALGGAQLAVALALRPRHAGDAGNPLLVAAVAGNALLALLGVWWHPLRALLRTQPLAPRDLLPCLVVAAGAWLLARYQRRTPVRERTPRQGPSALATDLRPAKAGGRHSENRRPP